MKIWILEIGEPLPLEQNVRLHRYGQFSKALAEAGHDVTWWASSFSHAPKLNLTDRDMDYPHGKATLRLLYGPGYPRNISFARIRHTKLFAKKFLEQASKYDEPDLIIAPIPTIDTAAAAVKFAKPRKIPVITDIRDLWPDEIADLAPRPFRGIARLLLYRAYQKLRYVCENAAGIMGVSQSYLDYGLNAAGRQQTSKDCVFPLGYSASTPSADDIAIGQEWLENNSIKSNIFTICFFGTIGKFFALETVIEAARQLEKEFPLQVIIGGTGSSFDKYQSLAKSVPSVRFMGWLKAPQIHAVMSISSAGLAPYKSDAKMSLPNKPFEYMAGGLPVISSIQGELKEILGINHCGMTYNADSIEELCATIRKLKEDGKTQIEMGRNGRALLEKEFATEKVFEKIEKHLVTFQKSQ